MIRLATAAAVLLLASASQARPRDPDEPQSRTGAYSRYESETIALTAEQRRLSVDPEPEGKIIEAIDVVALDVIEPRDPAPGLLNKLHWTSRDHVIRREVLVREGEPFRKVLVDETARNLRRYSQLSLVLCFAARGSTPDRVRLVVVTKDVWSLRLSWDASFSSGGGLERLVLAPTETNLLGYQHILGGRLELLPESYAAGLRYSIPRVMGSRVAAALEAGLIFNRKSGDREGSFGTVVVERPLFSTLTPWAFSVSATFRDEISRVYENGKVKVFDASSTPRRGDLPFLYRSERATAIASVTRSFGWAIKHDITGGVELLLRQFSVPSAGQYDPAALAEFERRRVPTSDDRLSPYLRWRSYTTSFLRTFDLESLALQEDVRLGHDVSLKLYPSSSSLGSTRTVFGAAALASYTLALGNGYARLTASSTTEHQPDRLADGQASIAGRIVTPRTPVGRVVVDGAGSYRYRNYLNRTSSLGGEGRLRGWPTGAFVGKDFIVYNAELRTRPLQLLSSQLGGVLFYDVGDAFDGPSSLDLRQAVGLGFRVLFPQLDRVVLRGDLGFPFERGGLPPGVKPYSVFVSFAQAFSDD